MKNNIAFYSTTNPILKGIALVLITLLLVGCDDFVEVAQPNSQLTGEAVFSDKATATAALKDIYAKIRDTGLLTGKPLGLSVLLGTYTDELVSYQTGISTSEPFYNNALTATNGPIQDIWTTTYNQLYAANAVIEGVTSSQGIAQTDKDLLIGEALFIRALLHSYLGALFNGCPYVTTTDYRLNQSTGRLSLAEIYENCITDLQQSLSLLPEGYITSERVRPNRYAAYALLARIDLYAGRWQQAADAADIVLGQALYDLEADLDKAYLKEASSTLWQLSSGGGYGNTQEGATFLFMAGPPPVAALRPEFIDAFESGDLRLVHWVQAITGENSVWYEPYKYKQGISASAGAEYSIVLGLSEQILIRAEARAHLGDLSGGSSDLNRIRSRAGLGDASPLTQQELTDAVLTERRFELFTEMGMRFFDLQRTGKLDQVLSPLKPGWNASDRYWPLPQQETLINPNLLPQNEGY